MTTIHSAVDLVAELPAGRALVAFAGACGQRAAGLWTAAEDPRLADLLHRALDATWRCAETGAPPPPGSEAPLLDELDEDSDFGDYHAQRMDALVTVAYAVAAAAALADEATLLRKASAAAKAEIRILEDAGEPATTRELSWQQDDLTDLLATEAPYAAIRSRAATAATLLRAGVMTGDWSGRPSGLDEPGLF